MSNAMNQTDANVLANEQDKVIDNSKMYEAISNVIARIKGQAAAEKELIYRIEKENRRLFKIKAMKFYNSDGTIGFNTVLPEFRGDVLENADIKFKAVCGKDGQPIKNVAKNGTPYEILCAYVNCDKIYQETPVAC